MTSPLPRVLSFPGDTLQARSFDTRIARIASATVLDLDARGWTESALLELDVAHFHVGQGLTRAVDLLPLAEVLNARGIPMVLTVHDEWPLLHDTRIADLVALAWSTIALTREVADLTTQVIGIRPRMIPHGPVLSPDQMVIARAHRVASDGPWGPVLVLLDSASSETAVDQILAACAGVSDEVPVHLLADDPTLPAVLDHWATADFTVASLTGMSVSAITELLSECRSVVLPPMMAMRAAMVELAADVGTPVIATDPVTARTDHAVITVVDDDGQMDVVGLSRAIVSVTGDQQMVRTETREREGHASLLVHEQIYHSAISCGPRPWIDPLRPQGPAVRGL